MQATKARKKMRPGVVSTSRVCTDRGSPPILLTVAAPTPFICGPSEDLNCKPPSPPPKPPTNHVHPTSPVRVITMKQVSPNSDQSDSGNHQTANYKKPRTHFTPQQLLYLEERFLEGHFPSVIAKENMAKEIDLTPYHIQIWFQNRRARFRRRERRSKDKELIKCAPKPPSFWPQHLPFDSNFVGVLGAGKDSQSTGTPSPSVSEPMKAESEPFSSPETPQLDNGVLESLTPEPPLTTGETTISGANTSPLSSPLGVTFAVSSTLTHNSQSPTISVSIQHHGSTTESSWNNPQPTYSADTTPASASPVTAHSLPSFNGICEKFPCNSNHPPYSSIGSVQPTTASTTFYSSATTGYTCMPLGPATLATTTHCSVSCVSASMTSSYTAVSVPPRPAAMPSHCSIEYVTPNPTATMTYCSADHVHPVPTIKTTYCNIDHVPPVGYAPPKPTTISPPVMNVAPATRAGALDCAPWMESISSTALSLMFKAQAATHTGEPVNHKPLPPSRPVTHPGAPTPDHLPLLRPVSHSGPPTANHLPLSLPVTHPGAPTADHLPLSRPVTHPGAPTPGNLPLSRAVSHSGLPTTNHPPLSRPVTHPGAPTADYLPLSRPVTHPCAPTVDHLPPTRLVAHSGVPTADKLPILRSATHPGAPTVDRLPPSRPVTHPGAPTIDCLPLSRSVIHPGAPSVDYLPQSRSVAHPGAPSVDHLPLSRPVIHPGAPSVDHLPQSRSVAHPGAPSVDHLPLSRPVTHPSAPTVDHLPLSRPVTHPGAPSVDHLPQSRPVAHPDASTAGHLSLSRLVTYPGAPTVDCLPPSRSQGAPAFDCLPPSRLVTHPGALSADHLPLSRLVTNPGAPAAGTVTPSLMTCSCNSATCASKQGSVISGALEKADGLTFTHNTVENHQSPTVPSLLHVEPPMQLADILGEEWVLGEEGDLLEPILTAEYQQTYVEPEPPMPIPSNAPYFHLHQQNSYHEPTPLSSSHVPVDRPILVQNPTAPPFIPQWQNVIPNLLPQFRPNPPARIHNKLSSTCYHVNYSSPLQSSQEDYTNPLPLHSRVPLMFGAGTNGTPYTLSSS